MRCRLCTVNEVHAPPPYDLCSACSRELGTLPMPPSRRPQVPCSRCTGTEFIRVLPREFQDEHAKPMAATFVSRLHNVGNHREPGRIWIDEGLGLLEMYICRGCGFTEWYCFDPERIPIGPEFNTELVTFDNPGPYR